MDAIQVDYSGRTKEASNGDKTSVAKAPAKYVFRPEVVKSLPKYSYNAALDGKDRETPKSLLSGKERRSSNGLRGLFGRVTRHSSDNKSVERDNAERKTSRSLFLAHDHSKDNAKLTELPGDRFGSPRRRKSGDENDRLDRRNKQHESKKEHQIDVRLRGSIDSERSCERTTNLSKHRTANNHSLDRHRSSTEHLETCQEEYRKNGKLCCSTTGNQESDDRNNHSCKNSERKCQHELPVREDERHQQHHRDEVVNREWSSPRHRSKYSFGSDTQKSQWSHPQQCINSSSSPEGNKYESGKPLRRVDSPYPCTNNVNHLSPSGDVLDVRGKLSTCKSIQDDFKQATSTIDASSVCATNKECENCGTAHSPSINYRKDDSAVDADRVVREEEKSMPKQRSDLSKRTEKVGSAGVTALLYRSRSLPQLSIHDSGVGSGNEHNPGRPTSRLVADLRQLLTLKQHYYPEGGWGWVIVVVGVLVQILSHGMHGSAGVLLQQVEIQFGSQVHIQSEDFELSAVKTAKNVFNEKKAFNELIESFHCSHVDQARLFELKKHVNESEQDNIGDHGGAMKDARERYTIVGDNVEEKYTRHRVRGQFEVRMKNGGDGRRRSSSDVTPRDIPICEDSGVATSGDLGEPSCSGEYDEVVCEVRNRSPSKKDVEEIHDPRYIAKCTIRQHYYPESGWGWVVVVTGVMVQILAAGIHGAAGIWLVEGMRKYRQPLVNVGWLGAMSTGVALLVSPVTIAFCRKKSTRVTAVLGGLVTALGCLFTSFASQFHQLFFSYGTVVGIGVGMTRDCSTLMVAQYFKRRREFVEIFIVSGSGLGIAVMSAFIKGAISKIGWRLGLQAVTGVVFLTFILGTFYRSASLYHPQRRAILHLKNQKRKIKDKNRIDDRPPFFDFSTLKSKTVRILLVSTGISAFGINTPIFYLAHQAEEEGLGDTVILLQAYLGLAWTLGCFAFGLLVVHHSVECRIARQYLTQAAVFMCGICILALTAVHGNYHGYVMFTWIYGIFCGGYHYSLKMYTYERVRARNFARTWGFVQCSQAIPIAIGVPISGYMNVGCGGKAGYYFSSTCVLVGSFTLFFIDLHRRNLSRHKHTRANGTRHLCMSDSCPQRRRLSFTQEPENEGVAAGAAAAALVLGAELAPGQGQMIDGLGTDKPELTCISEEGIADMDLPDNLLDDLDYIGDCITSCNKVENYLMLSEFENNLIAEMPIIMDRKGRRWSLARSKQGASQSGNGNGNGNSNGNGNGNGHGQTTIEDEEAKQKWRLAPAPPNNRVITVIDEAST